ncbi:hypothetical protein [Sporomusa acidovorans]|uniref:Uncharacterized protein n=1 Tax=Sporomusa acidovorans (strain ATCC 49682 / DSM 3132 / Mol) TaxID=1123286 RepID=A0ABZ3JA03_SPOA4|nr:hypothetical protein [Sporomusa acidovorans]OZC16224.1 hypothetical protein SPACI_45910 [Sporomusa acidovorans DSM 3132]SDE31881.1 hypothetical protein SAMN04488499_101193 [Sporomusa acidovorans]
MTVTGWIIILVMVLSVLTGIIGLSLCNVATIADKRAGYKD